MTRLRWPQSPPHEIAEAWDEGSTELVHCGLWGVHGGSDKICFGEELSAAQAVSMVHSGQARSLVQYNSEWYADDLRASRVIRERPSDYLARPGEVLLGGADEIWSWSFSSRSEKQELKERLLLQCLDGSDSLRESLGLVFEELFMNATIDAPREGQLAGLAHRPASSSQMVLTRRGKRVCLSCIDPYGALKVARFVARMNEVYSQGAGQVVNLNAERGGAGLGCVILFEQCSVLALGVEKGRRTAVSCVLPMALNHRQRAAVKKSLHVVEIDGGIG